MDLAWNDLGLNMATARKAPHHSNAPNRMILIVAAYKLHNILHDQPVGKNIAKTFFRRAQVNVAVLSGYG